MEDGSYTIFRFIIPRHNVLHEDPDNFSNFWSNFLLEQNFAKKSACHAKPAFLCVTFRRWYWTILLYLKHVIKRYNTDVLGQ